MQCNRCGHQMDNPDARFCGRCGLPLHADAPDFWHAPPDAAQSGPEAPYAPFAGVPSRSDPAASGSTARATAPFEYAVPGLDVLSEETDEVESVAAVRIAAPTTGPSSTGAMPLPPVPDLWPAVIPDAPRNARLDGCLIYLPGNTALIEMDLAADARLNVAAPSLLWSMGVRIDRPLVADGGAPEYPRRGVYLQLHGPGSAALTAGPAAMAMPMECASGTALIVGPEVLLAYSRRIRLARRATPVGSDLHVCATRAESVLLRCPAGARMIELPSGEWLTVAGNAVLARDASTGCVALERAGADGSRQHERRVTGPGRVVLGFWPPEAPA